MRGCGCAVVVATVASSSGIAHPGRAGHPPLIGAASRVRREEIKPSEVNPVAGTAHWR
jgi:hypothetical protein